MDDSVLLVVHMGPATRAAAEPAQPQPYPQTLNEISLDRLELTVDRLK
jgi:hypothetical protein